MNKCAEEIYYSNPDSAKKMWQQALNLNRKLALKKENLTEKIKYYFQFNEAEILFNLGSYYQTKSDIKKATDLYLEARLISEKIHSFLLTASINNNLGRIYERYLGDQANALRHYLRADSLADLIEASDAYRAIFLANIGYVYHTMNQPLLAEKYFKKCLEMTRMKTFNNNNKNGICNALLRLANFEFERGNYELSETILNENILTDENRTDMKIMFSNGLALRGKIMLKKGLVDKAEKDGTDALTIFKDLRIKTSIRNASKLLIDVFEKKNNWKKMHEMLLLYKQMNDSVYSAEIREEFIRQNIKFDYLNQKQKDSLSNIIKTQEKSNIIQKHHAEIQGQKNIRNISILVTFFFVIAGWIFYRKSVFKSILSAKKIKLKKLETEQKLIQTQMIPHFIFNSLNSIQGFILNNNLKEANIMLQNFSVLMRNLLEHSNTDFIIVQDEISFLRAYLEITKNRFKGKFDYAFSHEETNTLNNLRIPPLLILPFLQESIQRILQDEGNIKRLTISFLKNGDYLVCTIEDNAISSIRENNWKDIHDAIELSIERLLSLNQTEKELNPVKNENYTINGENRNLTRIWIKL